MRIDCDFPGGNILIDRIEGDTAFLRQDLRDTEGHWFYWAFRLRESAGRTIAIRFTNGRVLTAHGPCVSEDGGATWRWLGPVADPREGFTYAVPPDAGEVRFALGFPYQESHLRAFLERHRGHPNLEAGVLCRTPKGRPVERLLVGRLDGRAAHRVLLTSRHHACEAMATYALEGLLEAALAPDELGAWFRERAEIAAVPFVDKDGVQEGDQGKNRKPYDHAMSYGEDGVHPETRALKDWAARWSDGRLHFALDFHCPGHHGAMHEVVCFVGPRKGPEEIWRRTDRLSALLEGALDGSLPFRASDNLLYGKGWTKEIPPPPLSPNGRPLVSTRDWAHTLPGIRLAAVVEIPYANALGVEVTPVRARAFGRDLAEALRKYLEVETQSVNA